MQVRIRSEIRTQIRAQLERNYPNEGGGFLLGSRQAHQTIIQAAVEIENIFEEEEQYHRYAMSPQNWIQMEDEADARGLALVGYYHSHPDSPAVPSEYDRVHALPNFVYLITSVQAAQAAEMLAWQLNDDRERFAPLVLDVAVDAS